ncbi:hypothetical protein SS37A_24120 [Methylocystis iwaonis]|uniref:Uncharacterized protein n=1 Tax=Methylocystis iwaonis TaxID=2885079 RepID=A0ABN6VGU2_9HYPH|nr:hypothetical protein SS37A_24120 [Methylocystis iwaonis]
MHDAGFEQARRRVGVIFEKLRRALAVVSKIEAAVERRVAPLPALGDKLARMFRHMQAIHHLFAFGNAADELQTKRVEFARCGLDVVFDLAKREDIARAFLPIRLAVHMGVGEADVFEMRFDAVAGS